MDAGGVHPGPVRVLGKKRSKTLKTTIKMPFKKGHEESQEQLGEVLFALRRSSLTFHLSLDFGTKLAAPGAVNLVIV